MKRQLNTRLLIALVIPAVLCAAGGFFLWRAQIPEIGKKLRKQAEEAREQGRLDDAATYLGRYLRYEPSNPQILAAYGLLLDEMAETVEMRRLAAPVLRRALLRDPSNVDVRKALVNIMLETARLAQPDAESDSYLVVESLLKELPAEEKESAWAQRQLGRALEGQAKYKEAEAAFGRAIELDPKLIDAYKPRADLLRTQLNRAAEADALMDALIAANPQAFRAYLERADYRQRHKLAGEGEDLAEALKLAPDDASTILESAIYEIRTPRRERGRQADTARIRELLTRGMELHPTNIFMYQILAEVELDAGRVQEAEALLRKGISATNSMDLSWMLVNVFLDTRQLEKAETLIKTIEDRGLPLPLSKYLEARVQFARGNWRDGLRALEETCPRLESGPAGSGQEGWRRIAAQAYFELGNAYERLRALPKSERAQTDVELTQGAINAYVRSIELDSSRVLAQVALASVYNREGRGAEAIRLIDSLAQDTLNAQILRVQLRAAQVAQTPEDRRDWGPVDRMLDELEKSAPGVEDVQILRARVDLAQNQAERARARLEAARKAHPEWLKVWMALSDLAEREGRLTEAVELLTEAERRLGDSRELFAYRVGFWARRDPEASQQALLNMVPRIATFPADDQPVLTALLASALGRTSSDRAALNLWQSLAQRQPDQPGIQSALFDIAFRLNDDAAMEESIAALRRIEGEKGFQWRYAQAGRLISQARQLGADAAEEKAAKLSEASALLDEVERLRSSWSRVWLMRAILAEIRQDTNGAIDAYRKSLDLGERQTAVVRRLVELLYQRKDYDAADAEIRKLQADAPLDTRLKRMAAEISVGTGDQERALKLAREAVPANSTDFQDYVWLGQVMLAFGQAGPAEQEFRKAVSMAKDTPDAWLALIQFLIRAKRNADAEQALSDATKALPPDQAALTLARGYELLGRTDEALALFQKSVEANPGDMETLRAAVNYYMGAGRMALAEPLLRSLIDSESTSQEDRVWARRTLGLALSTPANRHRFEEALTLLEANMKESPGSVDELRAKAIILAARNDRRADAIKAFEDAAARQPLPSGDMLLLARLYEAHENWPKARDTLLSLIANNPKAPEFLVAYLESLMRRKDYNEARVWLARLEGIEPGSLRTLIIKARVLKAQNQPLGPVADELRALAQRVPQRANVVAALFEKLGDLATAEGMYRQLAGRRNAPEGILELAQFLGRQGRAKEGFDLCEEALKVMPAERVAAAALGILSSTDVSFDAARRIEGWIDAAQKTATAEARDELENQRAILWTLEGRREDAMGLYRKLLAQDPNNPVVLNNLAWMLALTGSELDNALEYINKAVDIVGAFAALLDTRAIVRLARNEPDLALSDLAAAIGSMPSPVYYFHLARARLANQEKDLALDALEKAEDLGLKPTDIDPLERAIYADVLAELRGN